MVALLAAPDTVLIDRVVGGLNTGRATIVYERGDYWGPILWERIVGESWVRVLLEVPRVISSPSGDPERDGQFFSPPLKPGQIYQVLMYQFDYFDPNSPGVLSREKPEGFVTVFALLKDPENKSLIVSEDQNVGGTWYQKTVNTVMPTTFLLQVSKTPPFLDSQGVERFLTPIASTLDTTLAAAHDQLAAPLPPGNDLFYLMRVVDDVGNWQTVTGLIRTKQRKVTIRFDRLHIMNDGALGDTTAEFRI